MDHIESAIRNADISLGAALEGDCGPIARAIRRVFGGQYAVILDQKQLPRHAAVYIDGQLYDGTGQSDFEYLVTTFTSKSRQEINGDKSIDECEHVELRDQLSGFRSDEELTTAVEEKLRNEIEHV